MASETVKQASVETSPLYKILNERALTRFAETAAIAVFAILNTVFVLRQGVANVDAASVVLSGIVIACAAAGFVLWKTSREGARLNAEAERAHRQVLAKIRKRDPQAEKRAEELDESQLIAEALSGGPDSGDRG